MSGLVELAEARARATAARAEFKDALAGAKEHVRPERLRDDAIAAASQKVDETKQVLRQSARQHPLILWSIVAALAVLFLRRPAKFAFPRIRNLAARLARRCKHWRKAHD